MPILFRSRFGAILLTVTLNALVGTSLASDPETARLIDQLTEVGEEGIGFDSMAWAKGFIAIDQEPAFRGGIIGSPRPVASPVLRALVRKGVVALPDLLDHLSDRRETKVKVGGFMGMWHSDEYEPRQRPAEEYRPGPKPRPGFDPARERHVRSYAVRVGDLCFVAVGQIVNRNLMAMRYQPSMCLVINSPVETPALADSVRKDWGGLTPEQHKRSLARDSLAPLYDTDPGALVRLLFYYPEEGDLIALKLLERPVIDDSATWNFITTRLAKETCSGRWKPLVEQFRRQYGPGCAEVIPFLLRWIYWRTDFAETAEFLEERARAARVLSTLYADDDPEEPGFINAVGPGRQAELIAAIGRFASARLDAAVHRLWRSIPGRKPADDNVRYEWDCLTEACVRRLIGRGYPDVILPYLILRADEIANDAGEYAAMLFEEVRHWLPLWLAGASGEDGDE